MTKRAMRVLRNMFEQKLTSFTNTHVQDSRWTRGVVDHVHFDHEVCDLMDRRLYRPTCPQFG